MISGVQCFTISATGGVTTHEIINGPLSKRPVRFPEKLTAIIALSQVRGPDGATATIEDYTVIEPNSGAAISIPVGSNFRFMVGAATIHVSVNPGTDGDATAILALFAHEETLVDRVANSTIDAIASRLATKLG